MSLQQGPLAKPRRKDGATSSSGVGNYEDSGQVSTEASSLTSSSVLLNQASVIHIYKYHKAFLNDYISSQEFADPDKLKKLHYEFVERVHQNLETIESGRFDYSELNEKLQESFKDIYDRFLIVLMKKINSCVVSLQNEYEDEIDREGKDAREEKTASPAALKDDEVIVEKLEMILKEEIQNNIYNEPITPHIQVFKFRIFKVLKENTHQNSKITDVRVPQPDANKTTHLDKRGPEVGKKTRALPSIEDYEQREKEATGENPNSLDQPDEIMKRTSQDQQMRFNNAKTHSMQSLSCSSLPNTYGIVQASTNQRSKIHQLEYSRDKSIVTGSTNVQPASVDHQLRRSNSVLENKNGNLNIQLKDPVSEISQASKSKRTVRTLKDIPTYQEENLSLVATNTEPNKAEHCLVTTAKNSGCNTNGRAIGDSVMPSNSDNPQMTDVLDDRSFISPASQHLSNEVSLSTDNPNLHQNDNCTITDDASGRNEDGIMPRFSETIVKPDESTILQEQISRQPEPTVKVNEMTLKFENMNAKQTNSKKPGTEETTMADSSVHDPQAQRTSHPDEIVYKLDSTGKRYQAPRNVPPEVKPRKLKPSAVVVYLSGDWMRYERLEVEENDDAGMYYKPTYVTLLEDETWKLGDSYSNTRKTWKLGECWREWETGKVQNDTVTYKNQQLRITIELLLSILFYKLREYHFQITEISAPSIYVGVPFWFTSRRRQQILDAAAYAGFEKARVLNENSLSAYYMYLAGIVPKNHELIIFSMNSSKIDISVYRSTSSAVATLVGNCGDYEKDDVCNSIGKLSTKYEYSPIANTVEYLEAALNVALERAKKMTLGQINLNRSVLISGKSELQASISNIFELLVHNVPPENIHRINSASFSGLINVSKIQHKAVGTPIKDWQPFNILITSKHFDKLLLHCTFAMSEDSTCQVDYNKGSGTLVFKEIIEPYIKSEIGEIFIKSWSPKKHIMFQIGYDENGIFYYQAYETSQTATNQLPKNKYEWKPVRISETELKSIGTCFDKTLKSTKKPGFVFDKSISSYFNFL